MYEAWQHPLRNEIAAPTSLDQTHARRFFEPRFDNLLNLLQALLGGINTAADQARQFQPSLQSGKFAELIRPKAEALFSILQGMEDELAGNIGRLTDQIRGAVTRQAPEGEMQAVLRELKDQEVRKLMRDMDSAARYQFVFPEAAEGRLERLFAAISGPDPLLDPPVVDQCLAQASAKLAPTMHASLEEAQELLNLAVGVRIAIRGRVVSAINKRGLDVNAVKEVDGQPVKVLPWLQAA